MQPSLPDHTDAAFDEWFEQPVFRPLRQPESAPSGPS